VGFNTDVLLHSVDVPIRAPPKSPYQHSEDAVHPAEPEALLAAIGFRAACKAATRIAEAWRRCIADPAYVVCRRRLQREFDAS
jgi:hypothetical protein